jgi:energy-coupling factor transporter ATP-binding protein EcfA2
MENIKERTKIVIIVGPTASGKSSLALYLAGIFDGEIVSADSMQVYRFMDIGTAKPSKEERGAVPHHVIDVVDPDEDYSAASFRIDARKAIREIGSRGKKVFVVGGTGLYIRALTKGLFEGPGSVPELRERFLNEAELKGRVSLYEELRKVDPGAASHIHPNNLAGLPCNEPPHLRVPGGSRLQGRGLLLSKDRVKKDQRSPLQGYRRPCEPHDRRGSRWGDQEASSYGLFRGSKAHAGSGL